MLTRQLAELVFQQAARACDPGRRVAAALLRLPVSERRLGIAIGKAAQAMARGVGPVARGVVVTHADDGGELPSGWTRMIASHPVPDERSVEAGAAVMALAKSAAADDQVVVAISGGASALVEQPRVPLAELTATTSAVMAGGARIAELNVVRSALSEIKGGRLAVACAGSVITLAASDVIGDHLETIGSGPTIGPWLHGAGRLIDFGAYLDERRREAIAICERLRVSAPAILREPIASHAVTRARDRAEVVAPLGEFAKHVRGELGAWGVPARGLPQVLEGNVAELAVTLAKRVDRAARSGRGGVRLLVGYGEPTIELPPAGRRGEGGRAQQLALELAKHVRGTAHVAFVAGTDGKDGPAPKVRPSPAGAFVDGTTWDKILATGRDPDEALARCDAGTVLDAVDALFVSGPTGINHADVVIVG